MDNIRIEELDQQAGHSRRQMEEIETAEAKLEVLRRQATEQGQLAAGYEELKRAFSQDGIPHNIVRSIVPLFEATATSIIGQMSGGHMSIEMRMEKTLKSNSKKEVTALDVIVNDAATGALPYMSRSGGERVKAALSVILALAELKSSTAGVQLGFLFIDEPPFLDDKGVQAYCDALEAIQKRYSSLKIMAITHDPEMKARFPQAVDVVKTAEAARSSTLEITSRKEVRDWEEATGRPPTTSPITSGKRAGQSSSLKRTGETTGMPFGLSCSNFFARQTASITTAGTRWAGSTYSPSPELQPKRRRPS